MIKLLTEALHEVFKGQTRPRKPVSISSSRNYLALYDSAIKSTIR